jgi:hypothetical protein
MSLLAIRYAKLLTEILGFEVQFTANLQNWIGDVLYVAQYSGSRFPLGPLLCPKGQR